jgi:pimeloyl-ACP methyl ester carboxylesterase
MRHALGITLFLLAAAPCALSQNQPFSVNIAGAGRPMILIPGLESSGAVWDGAVEHYRARYQMHVLTLAGFAGEPALPGLRLSDVRNCVIRYIREKKLDHPIIVGHSLGGFLALWIATTVPELTGRIVSVDGPAFLPALLDSSATAAEVQQDAERMRKLYASLDPAQMEAMARMALTQMISEPKNIEMAAAWAAKSDSGFVSQALYDLMTTDLRPEMAKIRKPVLLVAAAKKGLGDRARQAYEAQVETAPNHRVVVASKALHFIMFDDPEFLWSAIDGFLAEGETHAR